MPHRIIRSWYTGRWWVGCYIWYNEEGTWLATAPSSPFLAVPNVALLLLCQTQRGFGLVVTLCHVSLQSCIYRPRINSNSSYKLLWSFPYQINSSTKRKLSIWWLWPIDTSCVSSSLSVPRSRHVTKSGFHARQCSVWALCITRLDREKIVGDTASPQCLLRLLFNVLPCPHNRFRALVYVTKRTNWCNMYFIQLENSLYAVSFYGVK